MPEPDGAQAGTIFDKFVAIHVPHAAARTAHNIGPHIFGILVVALGVGMRAAGYQRLVFRPQRVGGIKLQDGLPPSTNLRE